MIKYLGCALTVKRSSMEQAYCAETKQFLQTRSSAYQEGTFDSKIELQGKQRTLDLLDRQVK